MKLFWITLLISSLVSCHNFKEDRQLSFALERAGENRRELEQVLEHYKNDSLKYRAACFLIKVSSINSIYPLVSDSRTL